MTLLRIKLHLINAARKQVVPLFPGQTVRAIPLVGRAARRKIKDWLEDWLDLKQVLFARRRKPAEFAKRATRRTAVSARDRRAGRRIFRALIGDAQAITARADNSKSLSVADSGLPGRFHSSAP